MLVYNRVDKTGSTSITELLRALAKSNHFQVRNHANYYPDDTQLALDLSRLRAGDVYVNHANFLAATRTNTVDPLAHSGCAFDRMKLRQCGQPFYWFNVVRDPVERMASRFYYRVDQSKRGKQAVAELQKRKADPRCGCAGLEFDACVLMQVANGCVIRMQTQMGYFCEPKEERTPGVCKPELAIRRLEHSYAVVGLTDEPELTVRLLEARLPRWFGNASARAKRMKRAYQTSTFNPLTNTTMNGCVSKKAAALLARHAIGHSDEVAFYVAAKRLFWRRAAEAGLLSELRP